MGKNKTYSAAAAGVAALVGSMVAGVPAYAGGGDFTEESGTCSMSSTWDMKAKPENAGRIEMEFSVDSNRLGQKWAVKVFDNRKLMFSGSRTTRGISRSFSFDKLMVNRAGTDRLVARAKNFRTGEICRGHVALVPDGGGNSG
jgi:hypothetical protein